MVRLWRLRTSRRSFTLAHPPGLPVSPINTSNASSYYQPLPGTEFSSSARIPPQSLSEPPPLPTSPPPSKPAPSTSLPANTTEQVHADTMGCVSSRDDKPLEVGPKIVKETSPILQDNVREVKNVAKTAKREEELISEVKTNVELKNEVVDVMPIQNIHLETRNDNEAASASSSEPIQVPTIVVSNEISTAKIEFNSLDEVPEVQENKSVIQEQTPVEKVPEPTVEEPQVVKPIQEIKNEKKIGISGVSSGDVLGNKKKKGVLGESAKDIEITRFEKDSASQDLIRKGLHDNEFLNFGLDSKQLIQSVVDAMYIKNVPAGCTIIKEGEAGSELYVCGKGSFDVYKGTKKVNTLGPGTVFGELAVLYHSKRNASIIATCDSSLWVLDRKVFHRIMMKAGIERQEENIKFLRSVPLLKSLDKASLIKMSDLLKMEYFAPGQIIIQQGDEGSTFYIITRGKVKVVAKKPDQTIEIKLEKGAFFGERALINDEKRAATVSALDGGTECLVLSRAPFMELLGSLEALQIAAGKVSERPSDAKQVSEYDHVKLTDLSVVGTLGVGGFGRVELVKSRAEGECKHFALKRIKKIVILEQQQQEHIFNEKEIMLACRSPFIARLYKTYHDKKYLFLLMEACMGGDVWTLLQKYHFFDEDTSRFMTGCVVLGLEYLHTRGIVYRDLKPENMMLSANGYIKLVDFGFAKKIGNTNKTWTFAGTPEYLAPEIIRNKGHDRAADYWSLGIFVHELLAGRPPFRGNDHHRTYNLILKGIDYMPFPGQIQKAAAIFIRKLCRPFATDRLGYQKEGISGIKNHKWFNDFNWEALESNTMKAPIVPRLSGPEDVNNFEKYPKDKDIPPDEISGWDEAF